MRKTFIQYLKVTDMNDYSALIGSISPDNTYSAQVFRPYVQDNNNKIYIPQNISVDVIKVQANDQILINDSQRVLSSCQILSGFTYSNTLNSYKKYIVSRKGYFGKKKHNHLFDSKTQIEFPVSAYAEITPQKSIYLASSVVRIQPCEISGSINNKPMYFLIDNDIKFNLDDIYSVSTTFDKNNIQYITDIYPQNDSCQIKNNNFICHLSGIYDTAKENWKKENSFIITKNIDLKYYNKNTKKTYDITSGILSCYILDVNLKKSDIWISSQERGNLIYSIYTYDNFNFNNIDISGSVGKKIQTKPSDVKVYKSYTDENPVNILNNHDFIYMFKLNEDIICDNIFLGKYPVTCNIYQPIQFSYKDKVIYTCNKQDNYSIPISSCIKRSRMQPYCSEYFFIDRKQTDRIQFGNSLYETPHRLNYAVKKQDNPMINYLQEFNFSTHNIKADYRYSPDVFPDGNIYSCKTMDISETDVDIINSMDYNYMIYDIASAFMSGNTYIMNLKTNKQQNMHTISVNIHQQILKNNEVLYYTDIPVKVYGQYFNVISKTFNLIVPQNTDDNTIKLKDILNAGTDPDVIKINILSGSGSIDIPDSYQLYDHGDQINQITLYDNKLQWNFLLKQRIDEFQNMINKGRKFFFKFRNSNKKFYTYIFGIYDFVKLPQEKDISVRIVSRDSSQHGTKTQFTIAGIEQFYNKKLQLKHVNQIYFDQKIQLNINVYRRNKAFSGNIVNHITVPLSSLNTEQYLIDSLRSDICNAVSTGDSLIADFGFGRYQTEKDIFSFTQKQISYGRYTGLMNIYFNGMTSDSSLINTVDRINLSYDIVPPYGDCPSGLVLKSYLIDNISKSNYSRVYITDKIIKDIQIKFYNLFDKYENISYDQQLFSKNVFLINTQTNAMEKKNTAVTYFNIKGQNIIIRKSVIKYFKGNDIEKNALRVYFKTQDENINAILDIVYCKGNI